MKKEKLIVSLKEYLSFYKGCLFYACVLFILVIPFYFFQIVLITRSIKLLKSNLKYKKSYLILSILGLFSLGLVFNWIICYLLSKEENVLPIPLSFRVFPKKPNPELAMVSLED